MDVDANEVDDVDEERRREACIRPYKLDGAIGEGSVLPLTGWLLAALNRRVYGVVGTEHVRIIIPCEGTLERFRVSRAADFERLSELSGRPPDTFGRRAEVFKADRMGMAAPVEKALGGNGFLLRQSHGHNLRIWTLGSVEIVPDLEENPGSTFNVQLPNAYQTYLPCISQAWQR